MELYMEEKWKLAKKGSGDGSNGGSFLKSSSGLEGQGKEGRRRRSMVRSFSSRCASLVKEQRARVYIVRRCVTMLICWRDYS